MQVQGSSPLRAELIAARDLSSHARLLTLRAECPLSWRAGQYVIVSASGVRFPYSIAAEQGPRPRRELELAVGTHESSQAIWRAPLGAELGIEPPSGDFCLPGRLARRALFVAAGTGIAPLRAMMQAVLRVQASSELGLLFGVRNEAELLFEEEWRAWVSTGKMSYWPVVSQPSASWSGWRGRVHDHLPELATWVRQADVFVCGSAQMVAATQRALRHIHQARVFTERQ